MAAARWSLIAEPVIEARGAHRQTIARSHELIARYDHVGIHRDRLEKQLAGLRKRGRSTAGYLTGANHSLTAAALQDRIKRIVTVNGGAIRSSQALPPKEDQGLNRLPVRVQLIWQPPCRPSADPMVSAGKRVREPMNSAAR